MPHGRILSLQGEVLGEHEGIAFYTVGQRRGLPVQGREPLYVVEIDAETRNIVVGPREAILSGGLTSDGLVWMGMDEPAGGGPGFRAQVQIRHRHPAVWSTVHVEEGVAHVDFDAPQAAVSPGQAAVFYDDGERVLGGGWIISGCAASQREKATAPS